MRPVSMDRLLLMVEDYLDGTLGARDREAFERALRTRRDLREEVETCRRLLRLAGGAPPVAIPPDLGEGIRRRLARARRRGARVIPLLGAAAAAAVLLLVFPLPRTPPRPGALPRVSRKKRGPALSPHALADWLRQAENAGPGDAAWLAAEARELGLLSRVRSELRDAAGARRGFFAAAEDLLVQVQNDPGSLALAEEARIVSFARSP